MKKMGYIGKSFALGSLGILGSIIAACGGGGVTDVVAADAKPSPYVLFASQYEMTGGTSEPFARSLEGGNVFSFFDGGFFYTWGLGENADYLKQRQAYGVQGTQNAKVDSSNYFGLAVSAPENMAINISESGTLIVQMGNGASTDAFANSHMVFTIALSGGNQDGTTYAWDYSCEYDQQLDADSRPGSSQTAATNPYGLRTYKIPLANFTCNSGSLSDVQANLKEVAIKVIGGKDSVASNETSNNTLLQIGTIAFSK